MSGLPEPLVLKQRMLNHASIKKACRVFSQHHSSPAARCQLIADQYTEFITLKILSGDFHPSNAALSPGLIVDQFWHCHILDTAGYTDFLKEVFPPLGPMVHHDAEKSFDPLDMIQARQEQTRKVF